MNISMIYATHLPVTKQVFPVFSLSGPDEGSVA